MSKFILSAITVFFLAGTATPLAFAESELDKVMKHDADLVDNGAKHDHNERHKADKHIDKEVKKAL